VYFEKTKEKPRNTLDETDTANSTPPIFLKKYLKNYPKLKCKKAPH
jgi:hypothetical protein